MNKVQKKIMEAVGLHKKNRLTFSKFSQEHTLSASNKKMDFKMPVSVLSQRNNCLVLASAWFRESGMYLSWGSIGSFFFLGMFFFASIGLIYYNGFFSFSVILALIFSFCILFSAGYPLFFAAKSELKVQGLKYVLFNAGLKNIYYVSDVDFQPKICHWEECTFCLAYSVGSIEGFYYELKGYLFNGDGSVRDSFSFDDYYYMTANSERQRQLMIDDLSARFEYVRRFMEDGADSVKPVAERLDLKPSLSKSAQYLFPSSKSSEGKIFHVLYSITRGVLFIFVGVQVIGHYFFCRYCRLPEWPQSVIDECGEEVFPRR